MNFRSFMALSMVLAFGCTDSHTGDDDGGTGPLMDAGPSTADAGMTGVDAGPSDTDGGGSTVDAGDAIDAGGPTVDAGGPVVGPDGGVGVGCGTMTCTGTQICCVMMGGALMCSEPADCMGAEIACDGPEDCASGENCCGGFTGGARSECRDATMGCAIRLCHSAAECDMGDNCCPYMTSGYCLGFACPAGP